MARQPWQESFLHPSSIRTVRQSSVPWPCSARRSGAGQTERPAPCQSVCWPAWGRVCSAPAAAPCRRSPEKTREWSCGRRWTGAHLVPPRCATACSCEEPWDQDRKTKKRTLRWVPRSLIAFALSVLIKNATLLQRKTFSNISWLELLPEPAEHLCIFQFATTFCNWLDPLS